MNKIWKRIAVIAVSGVLLISLLASTAIAATTTYQGRKEIVTTGTRVALAGAQEVDWVVIVADMGNDRPVTIGSVTVTVDQSSTDGPRIGPGKSLRLGPCDLADVYINGKAENAVYYVAASGGSVTGTVEVVQDTQADLKATVYQSTATNLHVEAEQATASELNVTTFTGDVEPEDVTIYLVGADLTTDGVAYSDVKQTVSNDVDITVFEYTFEPEGDGGDIIWVYFNIVATLKGADAQADLKMTMQVRNKDGTWQNLFAQVTYADINTTYLDKRYEGYLVADAATYCTPGDADLWTYFNEVPFDFRVLLQAADSTDGYGKIKNCSLIRVIYKKE